MFKPKITDFAFESEKKYIVKFNRVKIYIIQKFKLNYNTFKKQVQYMWHVQ